MHRGGPPPILFPVAEEAEHSPSCLSFWKREAQSRREVEQGMNPRKTGSAPFTR